MVKNIWGDKEATEQIIKQVRDARVIQLEEALCMALNYLSDLMGSDFDDSETIHHIEAILNGGEQ